MNVIFFCNWVRWRTRTALIKARNHPPKKLIASIQQSYYTRVKSIDIFIQLTLIP